MKKDMQKTNAKGKTAEYVRISSAHQDARKQHYSNAKYFNEPSKDEVITFIDNDVSVVKTTNLQRPALSSMLEQIKNGTITKVVCFDRNRLARDFYDYINILKVYYDYDVEVEFTASNEPPFSTLQDEIFYCLNSTQEAAHNLKKLKS